MAHTVIHIIDHFLPRSQTFIYTLLRGLRQYRNIVYNRHRRQHANLFPVERHYSPVERIGRWAGIVDRLLTRHLGYSPYFARVCALEKPALVHAHFGQIGALFAPLARRHHLPLVVSFYGQDISVFLHDARWQDRFHALWTQGERFLVLGPQMREQLIRAGCPSERVEILPLPLDLSQFPFTPPRPPAPGSSFRLLTVGRLVPKKGVDVLLHAVARLASDYPLLLTVAGDGPERPRLERLAQKLNIQEQVRFLGWFDHTRLSQLFAQTHIFVLASRTDPRTGDREGTPTVLLEAQAAGLPVVSTLHSDIPFIVRHQVTGILVPEGDAEALADALATLLNHPEQWQEMGAAGRALVQHQHDMNRVGQQLGRIFRMCMGDAP